MEKGAVVLRVSDLSCVRGDRTLFSGLSFALAAGQLLHVRGDNGVGKTSLLRLLVGLSAPATGTISWQGISISDPDSDFRRQMVFLGHHVALKSDLTALENLTFAAAMEGLEVSRTDLLSALAEFGLRDRAQHPVAWLSAGQTRRVLLAWLAIKSAPLWVLDEPFNALDVRAVDDLSSRITAHLTQGGLVVMTSHQPLPFSGVREVWL